MANLEKEIVEAVLAAEGRSAAKLGLRFDRVVGRVLGDLRAFADGAAPEGATVVVTLTAPILVPAKTTEAVRGKIGPLLASAGRDDAADVHGNALRLRLVRHGSAGRPKLVGFVHNRDVAPEPLLDLAERCLRR